MIIAWIVAAICGIISIFILCGKGSWLVAGYNIMSKEEKAQYDEKKVCRLTGILMLIITILIVILIQITEYGSRNDSPSIISNSASVFGFMVIVLCIGFCIFFDRLTKIKHKK
ncbi:DUF3784 domain-containing protein [Clostridium sp. KNHs214]|uniref:DUF3784 domain-containing protein n=1 Tax=Clostridium sp. KNHs214 TaxID=1540257 RepID=UPI00068EB105|nr:DUF3784 domain-containing protein [Clostridium sp. KNHs214]